VRAALVTVTVAVSQSGVEAEKSAMFLPPVLEHESVALTTDTTTQFFQEIAARGHEPALEKVTGTLRFDLTDGKRTTRWLITIRKGDVDVSRRNAKADCVVRGERGLFDRIASGEMNALVAFLRGALEFEGNRWLMLPFQRLFPGPPRSGS
jgi:putative sterol carrier protein